jgi:SAM-dependent methyltransferase
VLKAVSRQDVVAFRDDPRGAGWRDKKEQEIKFNALLSVIVDHVFLDDEVSILDVGCGSGAFYRFLKKQITDIKFEYHGIDLVAASVDLAIGKNPELKKKSSAVIFWIMISEGNSTSCSATGCFTGKENSLAMILRPICTAAFAASGSCAARRWCST